MRTKDRLTRLEQKQQHQIHVTGFEMVTDTGIDQPDIEFWLEDDSGNLFTVDGQPYDAT